MKSIRNTTTTRQRRRLTDQLINFVGLSTFCGLTLWITALAFDPVAGVI